MLCKEVPPAFKNSVKFLGLILSTSVLVLPSLTWENHEKVSNENTCPIEVRADQRLFIVVAFINAAGFDDEHGKEGVHPVRTALREDLQRLDATLLKRMTSYYQKHQDWHAYTTYSFMLCNPPKLQLEKQYWKDANKALPGFDRLLREFYKKGNIERLWQKYKPAYDSVVTRVKNELSEELLAMGEYLRIPKSERSAKGIAVIPNLLNSYYRATLFEDSLSGITYVIPGPPSPKSPIGMTVVHEMLHTFTIPLLSKYDSLIEKKRELISLVEDKPTVRDNYGGDWPTILDESLVRALTWRILYLPITPAEIILRNIEREYREGFILIWYFYEKLADYEKSKIKFTEYYPILISGIDVRVERKRWAKEKD